MDRRRTLATAVLVCALWIWLSQLMSGDAVPARQHDSGKSPPQLEPGAPAPPAAGRVALLHMYDDVPFFRRLGALTAANKARYAARHGYELILRTPETVSGLWKKRACHDGEESPCWAQDTEFDIDHSRRATFGKLKFAIAACNRREGMWLLWSDADAMVVNQTVPLEDIIDDGYDIMLAYDWLMLQAGVLLFKCSPFTLNFLNGVYNDRSFDTARALDQSALQAYMEKLQDSEREAHIKIVPKHAINVYLEEYRPGDFLLHMAGKLYEATEPGLWAIANQFDILSIADDIRDVDAFFSSRYFLNRFSGVCPVSKTERQSSCRPADDRRLRLPEALGSMSTPNRYRHVALRYYFLPDWKDKYDVPGWNVKRKALPLPESQGSSRVPMLQNVVPLAFPATNTGSSRQDAEKRVTAPHIELISDYAPQESRRRTTQAVVVGRPRTPHQTLLLAKAIVIFAFLFTVALGIGAAHRSRRSRLSIKQH